MRIGAVVAIAVLCVGPAAAGEVKLQAARSDGTGVVELRTGLVRHRSRCARGVRPGATLMLASGDAHGAVAAAGGVAAVRTLPASVTGAVVGRRGPVWAGALAGAGVEALPVAALVASIDDDPGSDTSGLVALGAGLGAGLGAVSGGVAAAVAHEPSLRVGGASLTAAVLPARGKGPAGSMRVTFEAAAAVRPESRSRWPARGRDAMDNAPESHMLAITRDGRRGYTSNVGPGTVSVLDLEAQKFIAVNAR